VRTTGQDGPASGAALESRLSSLKLRPPELRPITIRRPRLTLGLTEGRAKLVLIVAPPGHGKTSLLADWAATDRRRFAWVTVDRNDSDPTVFWTYVAAALATARGDAVTDERIAEIAHDRAVPRTLARQLEGFGEEVVLVLDDYFRIEGEAGHATLLAFLEQAPATVQVAIASRVEPPLPVARMRANGLVADVGPADLRFTLEESGAFLIDALQLSLDQGSIRMLHERTEGWPAGLYLAYLTLHGAEDPATFVRRFGASNRHVGEYLTEQVLEAQDPETLQFMLDTSVVDQLCGPLADALTGGSDSARRLREMERANVFLTPLDDVREWYRYHHLLREKLVLELRARSPDREQVLCRRAAEWFADVGDVDRAIRHFTAAGNPEQAARLVLANYVRRLEWAQFTTLETWLDQVGSDVVDGDARLLIVRSWARHFLGRRAEGDQALAAARELAASAGDVGSAGEIARDGGPASGPPTVEASGQLIVAAFPGGRASQALRAARRAYELDGDHEPMRASVNVALGFALIRAGEFEEADDHLVQGEERAVSAGLWMDAVGARCLRAIVHDARGDRRRAIHLARSAVDLAAAHGLAKIGSGVYARAVLGRVLVHAGEAAEGVALLREAVGPLRELGEPIPVAEALLGLAQGLFALNQRGAAKEVLAEADALIQSMPDPGALRATRHSISVTITRRSGGTDAPLSAREIEVLRMLAAGHSKREAATRLYVSYNTVHSHARAIYRKLGVSSRADAVEQGRAQGLIQ
jgi:LuxR family transcriptional regulator, maltose regulon positive regulatory protein